MDEDVIKILNLIEKLHIQLFAISSQEKDVKWMANEYDRYFGKFAKKFIREEFPKYKIQNDFIENTTVTVTEDETTDRFRKYANDLLRRRNELKDIFVGTFIAAHAKENWDWRNIKSLVKNLALCETRNDDGSTTWRLIPVKEEESNLSLDHFLEALQTLQ